MSVQSTISMSSVSVPLQSFAKKSYPLELGLGPGLGLSSSNSRPNSCPTVCKSNFLSSSSIYVSKIEFRTPPRLQKNQKNKSFPSIKCAANRGGGKGSGAPRTPEQINSDARIRSEVISPFRTLRMALSLALGGSASLGGLVALTRLAGALGGAPGAPNLEETVQGLGIDVAAVLGFVLLYRNDKKAEQKSIARITREETLSALRIELSNKKVVTVGQMRGICRLVIMVGTKEHIEEGFRQAEPLKNELLERGVMIVPFCKGVSNVSSKTGQQQNFGTVKEDMQKVLSLGEGDKKFIATPIYTNEWAKWLKDQMALANVSDDKPVYLSLRLDGRVRGSGVGFPPFKALSLQLPPQTGMWAGPLDGMDGRV